MVSPATGKKLKAVVAQMKAEKANRNRGPRSRGPGPGAKRKKK